MVDSEYSPHNYPSKHSSWWKRLEDASSENVLIKTNIFTLFKRLQKTSWRRLDQDEYIHLTQTSSEDVLKMSWLRPICFSWSYVFKTSSRHLQDVFKTFSKRFLAKTSSKRLEDILQKRLQDIFKTSSRSLAKMSSRRFQDVSSS